MEEAFLGWQLLEDLHRLHMMGDYIGIDIPKTMSDLLSSLESMEDYFSPLIWIYICFAYSSQRSLQRSKKFLFQRTDFEDWLRTMNFIGLALRSSAFSYWWIQWGYFPDQLFKESLSMFFSRTWPSSCSKSCLRTLAQY